MKRGDRRSISTNVTDDEYDLILSAAKERGLTISRFLIEILSVYLNYNFTFRRPWGGDRAWSKPPEVHHRVVEKMNVARAKKQEAERKAKKQKDEK